MIEVIGIWKDGRYYTMQQYEELKEEEKRKNDSDTIRTKIHQDEKNTND